MSCEALEQRLLLTDTIPNDSIQTATPDADISDDPIDGHIARIVVENLSSQDVRDFFRFHAGVSFNGGNEVEIRLHGPGDASLQKDLRFRVYNSRGVVLKGNGESPGAGDKSFNLTVKGTNADGAQAFFIEVYGAPLGIDVDYQVDIIYVSANHTPVDYDHTTADQPGVTNDSIGTAGNVEPINRNTRLTVPGRIGDTDTVDYFRIVGTGTASRTFTIILTGFNKDLDFEVYGSNISRIGVANKAGNSKLERYDFKSKVNATTKVPDYYYIKVVPKTKITTPTDYSLVIAYDFPN